MALTLDPISNPDDIRAEASKVPSYGGLANTQSQESVPSEPASSTPTTPMAAEATTATAQPSTDMAEPEQDWRPYQTLSSSGVAAPAANYSSASANMAGDEMSYGYTYMVPAGIYAIVALSVAAALLYWVVIIFFKVHRPIAIVEAAAISVFGIGLLSRNLLIRYGAIVSSGVGAVYMAYQSFKLLQFASSDAATLLNSFGYSGYATGIIIIYMAITIALVGCCGYLLTGRVGRAFR